MKPSLDIGAIDPRFGGGKVWPPQSSAGQAVTTAAAATAGSANASGGNSPWTTSPNVNTQAATNTSMLAFPAASLQGGGSGGGAGSPLPAQKAKFVSSKRQTQFLLNIGSLPGAPVHSHPTAHQAALLTSAPPLDDLDAATDRDRGSTLTDRDPSAADAAHGSNPTSHPLRRVRKEGDVVRFKLLSLRDAESEAVHYGVVGPVVVSPVSSPLGSPERRRRPAPLVVTTMLATIRRGDPTTASADMVSDEASSSAPITGSGRDTAGASQADGKTTGTAPSWKDLQSMLHELTREASSVGSNGSMGGSGPGGGLTGDTSFRVTFSSRAQRGQDVSYAHKFLQPEPTGASHGAGFVGGSLQPPAIDSSNQLQASSPPVDVDGPPSALTAAAAGQASTSAGGILGESPPVAGAPKPTTVRLGSTSVSSPQFTNPFFLDDPDITGERRKKRVLLRAYVSTVISFADKRREKKDINRQFFIRHPRLEVLDIKLSHIRSIKLSLLQLCLDESSPIELTTLAYAAWYWERLITGLLVTKANRKLVVAACVTLAVKFWECGNISKKLAYTWRKLDDLLFEGSGGGGDQGGGTVGFDTSSLAAKVKLIEFHIFAALDFTLLPPSFEIGEVYSERLLHLMNITMREYFSKNFHQAILWEAN